METVDPRMSTLSNRLTCITRLFKNVPRNYITNS